MPDFLLQQVQFTGPLGFMVAAAVFVGIMFGTIKLLLWFWRETKPKLDRVYDNIRKPRSEQAFQAFQIQWLYENLQFPIFIFDHDKRCVFVNQKFTECLSTSFSKIEGRKWHRLIKESDLTRVLDKWDEAYRNQSPYVNRSVLIVSRQEREFMVFAEPFIWRGRVRYYIGRMEEQEG